MEKQFFSIENKSKKFISHVQYRAEEEDVMDGATYSGVRMHAKLAINQSHEWSNKFSLGTFPGNVNAVSSNEWEEIFIDTMVDGCWKFITNLPKDALDVNPLITW